MMYLLKKDNQYVGIKGLTVNMTEVFAVQYTNGNLYIPLYKQYLAYDGDRVLLTDTPTVWQLTSSKVLMTPDYKVLTYTNELCLIQSTVQWINHTTGVYLCSPNTVVETLITDGVVFLPADLNKDLHQKLIDSPHERVSNLLELDTQSVSVLANKRLQSLLEGLFGPEYHLTTFSSNKLVRNVDKRFWHVDYPYHNLQAPYVDHLPALWVAVQVIIPFIDFVEENGATQYIPGSHHLMSWPEPGKKARTLMIPKGMMAIFMGSMWHTQGINTTAVPRIGLLANFAPTYVPAKDKIAEEVERVPNGVLTVREGQVRFKELYTPADRACKTEGQTGAKN